MRTIESTVPALLSRLPDADSPGRESKFTGPAPEEAGKIASEILKGGRESILELVGMIRDAVGGGEENYKPGYALHCIALYVCQSGHEDARRTLVETLCSQLGGAEPSKEVQSFLIRELQVAGGAEAIEALGKQLDDDVLCEYATQALIAVGGDRAAAKVLAASDGASGKRRVTLLQALGVFRDAKAVKVLGKAMSDDDVDVRLAAGWALARIGAPDSVATVSKAAEAASGWERIQLTKACLLLAETLAASGKKAEARRLYAGLRDSRTDSSEAYVREAAERGLAGLSGQAQSL